MLHLSQAHEDAFQEMKKYYNDITRANLELISQLKAQVAQANDKQAANQRLMLEIAEENKKLSDPLQRATEELKSLQNDLRDADKDRQSLRYAKTRLLVCSKGHFLSLPLSRADVCLRYDDVPADA